MSIAATLTSLPRPRQVRRFTITSAEADGPAPTTPTRPKRPTKKMVAKKKATEEVVEPSTASEPIPAPTPPVTATLSAPPPEPPRPPLPSLSKEFAPGLKILFANSGHEVVSDIPGGFTLAKRAAMAYATLHRTETSVTGVACDPNKAFEVVAYDPGANRVSVILRPSDHDLTMTLDHPSQKWVDKIPDQHPIDGLARTTTATGINYGSLQRVTSRGECPKCYNFIHLRHFETMDTDDAGRQSVATCPRCNIKLRTHLVTTEW